MSSVTGIIVMFVFFGIYGWLAERDGERARRRERLVTSPQRIAEATVVARPER